MLSTCCVGGWAVPRPVCSSQARGRHGCGGHLTDGKTGFVEFCNLPRVAQLGLTAVRVPQLQGLSHTWWGFGALRVPSLLPPSPAGAPGAQLSAPPGDWPNPAGLRLSSHYSEWQLPQASSLFRWKVSLAGSGLSPVQVPFASQLLAPPRAVTWLDASYLGRGGTLPA